MILRRLEGLRRIINAITPLLCLLLALSILSDFQKILKAPITNIRKAQSEISVIVAKNPLSETLESINAAGIEIKQSINSINTISDTFTVPKIAISVPNTIKEIQKKAKKEARKIPVFGEVIGEVISKVPSPEIPSFIEGSFLGGSLPIPGVREIKSRFVSSLNDISTVLEEMSSLIEPLKSIDNRSISSILGNLKVLFLVVLAAILFPIPLYISWAGYQLRDGWRLFRGE